MSKRMTVKDLARIAGVNHSTVSRALNDSPRVHEATRVRIKALAQEHNFQFNSNARSLSRRKTGVIGIIYPAGMEDFNSSLYTNRLFIDLRKKLEFYQLDGILLEAYHPDTGKSNIERLISQNKVDGFLIIHGDIKSKDYDLIKEWKLPMVQVHLSSNNYSTDEIDYFFTDNRKGGELAALHLLERGCQRFFDVSFMGCSKKEDLSDDDFLDSERYGEGADRSRGFAVGLVNIPELRRYNYSIDGSFQAARGFVKFHRNEFKKGDGLFFHSDLMAFGGLTAFRELGIKVPEEIKIIGFDDSPIASLMGVGITTIHQPREELAERACSRISALLSAGVGELRGEDTKTENSNNEQLEKKRVQELLEPALVIRETT
ncbi:MAG: LacI family DNA-binding transcriptional regulator [Spirochaetales bacterium]|nr:LacI family DNA-binding transcriptional regulator [Spirochaetales bacterium]